ncbi:GNAT family N-acetyltransferase [bacterium]|nr:GNAT family N-acetyltransferase [bacterium]
MTANPKSRRLQREIFRAVKFIPRRISKKKFSISIIYETGVDLTERTQAVADAFGLGVNEEKTFTIYDDFTVELTPESVVYITGDSGSGKSVLLKWLEQHLLWETVNFNEIEIDESKPIIETLGKDVNEAIELLSRAGLGEAYLFLRKYSELSDGQKYRYRLAKLLELAREKGEVIIIADEFCSLLDRDTAKIVAYNFQKICRKQKIGLIVATCHTDLLEDLKPDVYIHKKFGAEVSVEYFKPDDFPSGCSIMREIRVEEGSTEDWHKLARFHYRSHRLQPPRKIFRAVRNGEVVGVIVYSYPCAATSGRKLVLPDYPKWGIRKLSEKLSTISRVVVHPKYRNIGLGVRLVKETLHKCGTPYVETIAVMAKYNPFFEKAGMKLVHIQQPAEDVQNLLNQLIKFGWNIRLASSKKYNELMLLEASLKGTLKEIRRLIASTHHPRLIKAVQSHFPYGSAEYYEQFVMKAPLERLAYLIRVVALLCQTKAYLFWSREWNGVRCIQSVHDLRGEAEKNEQR